MIKLTCSNQLWEISCPKPPRDDIPLWRLERQNSDTPTPSPLNAPTLLPRCTLVQARLNQWRVWTASQLLTTICDQVQVSWILCNGLCVFESIKIVLWSIYHSTILLSDRLQTLDHTASARILSIISNL